MNVLGWLLCPLAQCQPSLRDQHRGSHRSMDPSAVERALYNRRETSPLVSQQTPSSITQHLSSKAGFFFFSWPSAHMYIIIFYSGLSIPPLPPQENKPESIECASQRPRRWRPVGKGHAVVTAARPPQPAVLVDIGSTVYFSKEPSLCIRCIAATGFVFKA